jgi:ABC-type dipeptide/oligopeptide/nickel transport system permease subunit
VIAIMSILGPGLTNLYVAVGMVGWIPYARITREKRSPRATWNTCLRPMTTLSGLALLVVGVALNLIGDGLAERREG